MQKERIIKKTRTQERSLWTLAKLPFWKFPLSPSEASYKQQAYHSNLQIPRIRYIPSNVDHQKEMFKAFITKVATLFLQDARDAFETKTFS